MTTLATPATSGDAQTGAHAPAAAEEDVERVDDTDVEAVPQDDADDADDQDDDDEPEAVAPASSTPIALPSLDPVAVTGVFRGLALLLTTKGTTLLLAIAKTADEKLRVTIQPPPAPDEPASTVLPLTVVATAEEMDAQFVTALGTYKPARDYAAASAAETARATKAAADRARAEAEAKRKKPSPGARAGKPSGTLVVTTVPASATITVADNDGKSHTPASAQSLTLPVGKATVTATAEGHKTRVTTVTIALGKTETLALEMPAHEPSLF